MLKSEFARRLGEAAAQALAFARQCVIDPVPDEFRFDIEIKPHGPGHVGPLVDPLLEDLWKRAQRGNARELTLDQAVEELYLGERVPEWIDIALDSIEFPREDRWRAVSFLELCCSRTLVDDADLWYANEGVPPFHICGPFMPAGFGNRFTNAWGQLVPEGRRFFLPKRKRR